MTTSFRVLVPAFMFAAAIAPLHLAMAQDCEACGVAEAPSGVSWTARIAPIGEPGERLVIAGTVKGRDGRPLAGVIVYAYHTNAKGVYAKRGDERGYARWHGYIRGWARTDAQGRFEFETIRPGSYPTRPEPAHVHFEIRPSGADGFTVDDLVATDDPLADSGYRSRVRNRGGSGIAPFTRDAKGVWHARRDIVLDR